MRKIFISYRRDEAEYAAGRLFDALCTRFGEEQVFRDKEAIAAGESWKRRVQAEIERGSALLVFIGRDWARMKNARGERRLDHAEDPLRIELAAGLTSGASLIPLLLENAYMPSADELPPELRSLAELNALKLRDTEWQYDLEILFRTLEKAGFRTVAASTPPPAEPVAAPRDEPVRLSPQVPASGAPRTLIASFTLIGLLLLGLAWKHGPAIYWVSAVIAVGAAALAVMSYRDHRRTRSTSGWPAIGAIVLASITALLHAGSASLARSLNISGRWNCSTSVPVTFAQDGSRVTTEALVDGVLWTGSGLLTGRRLALDFTANGMQIGRVDVKVEEGDQRMSGRMSNPYGSLQISYWR